MPGLGQGHGKKRHLHAQRNVSFINNPEVKRRGHLLSRYLYENMPEYPVLCTGMNGILSVPLPRWEGLGEGENG